MAENVIRSAVWHSQLDAKGVTDHITVRNLQATVSAGVDVWNRNKSQQALITTTIYLRKPFDSAARGDTLDNSTVHYGKLSKTIKAGIENKAGTKIGHFYTHELALAIISFVDDMTSIEVMAATEVDVFYPKGSMLGDGAGYVHSVMQDGEPFSRVLYLRNVRVPCIIGVNSNERLQKQPVVINIWIECLRGDRTDDYPKLEAVVVQAVSESSFETLESLSTMVVDELRKKFFRKEDEGAYIRLRVEKPLAVPFADAPSIEILRPVKI